MCLSPRVEESNSEVNKCVRTCIWLCLLCFVFTYALLLLISLWLYNISYKQLTRELRGARGVMVIIGGNGHGDSSSNPGRDWLHFT